MRDAIRSQTGLGDHADTYGWVLLKEGKIERALKLLAVGVALAPNGAAYAHLAQAEAKLGHKDLALLYWREATFLSPGQMAQVPPDLVSQLNSDTAAVARSGMVPGQELLCRRRRGNSKRGPAVLFFRGRE